MPESTFTPVEASTTRGLARAILAVHPDAIPEPPLHRARQCLLDFLGVALGAADHPAVSILMETAHAMRTSPLATVLGHAERTDALWAALINGSMAHVLDFDDTHSPTILHGYSSILAAQLALAESLSAPVTGMRFLAAFLAGYETSARVALAVHPSHYDRGWHVSGTAGTFGAAAACGWLLGLSVDQMAQALGIAASQAAGLREMFGSMNKSLHVGKAAQNGLLAALLAHRGFTSSGQALEAPRGFCRVLSSDARLDQLTADWGAHWQIMSSGFKPFPCGVVTHAAIEAALALHDEQGVRAEEVETTHARCHPLVLELTGKTDPQTGLEGKFSIYHCLAAALVDGRVTPRTFSDERVHDAQVLALRARVHVTVDEALATDQAEVTVKLRSGQELAVLIEHAAGSPQHPLTDGQLAAKFTGLVNEAGRLEPGAAQEILEQVYRVETLPDVTVLLRLCRKGA